MLQSYNPQNDNIQIWVGDKLYPRAEARVSVFDSSVQGGDAVWEGLRVYREGIFCLERHLKRLMDSAHILMFENIPTREFIRSAIAATLKANDMDTDTHIRLTLTRGEKITSGMDPRLNQMGCCLIVLAEWKPPVYNNASGIRVITSSIRRNGPQFLDSKIHHNNLLNNILAKIQANLAGADAAVMLDQNGFVSELNDTNLFMARKGVLYTPYADACLPGITRELMIEGAKRIGVEVCEKNLSLSDFYTADEVFATGTMGELTPVVEIDGRKITNHAQARVLINMEKIFRHRIPEFCEKLQG
jgi:branched-chain amino acid aminotransferase